MWGGVTTKDIDPNEIVLGTLHSSGPISLREVRELLGNRVLLTYPLISISQNETRILSGIKSGTIKMSDFYGKTAKHFTKIDHFENKVSLDINDKSSFSFNKLVKPICEKYDITFKDEAYSNECIDAKYITSFHNNNLRLVYFYTLLYSEKYHSVIMDIYRRNYPLK